MPQHCPRRQATLLVGLTIFIFTIFCQLSMAQSNITAVITTQDLSSPDAAGWGGITGISLQTIGNPSGGGHGAVAGTLPMVNLKAAYNGERVFLRLEWDDSTETNQNRILTFDGATWNGSGNEDRLYVAWPILDGPGREGLTFADLGCAVMCHQRDPIDRNTLVPNTSQPMRACAVCHMNSDELKPADFVHTSFVAPPPDCSSCHGNLDRSDISGGDMIAAAGSAFDIWHWKAQRSDPIGIAEDQFSADTARRSRDGINMAPDNIVNGMARYVFVSGTTAVSDTSSLLLRSQIAAHLTAGTLAEWNDTNSRYELGDGTPVTVPNGTQVTRHILEDLSLSDPSATVQASSSYAAGKWSVALSRDLIVPGESALTGSLSNTDYAFNLNGTNRFGFAVTDNSGIDHKGFALVSLMFEPADLIAIKTPQNLASPAAPGWADIQGIAVQTTGNPSSGGHGAVAGTLPVVDIKAAYDGTQVFMRFEWDDSSETNRDRILTFDGANWNTSGNEDRLYVGWPIVDGPGRVGKTFAEAGCAVMCHQRDPVDGNTLVPNTTQTLAACSVCHMNSDELKPPDFVHVSFASPPAECSSCHGGLDREVISGGDMIAAAGSAYDIWHWKAQRSAPIGIAEDQFSADTARRGRDGINLAPDNSVNGVARYVFTSGTTAVSDTSTLLLRSQISALLASGALAEWNDTNSQYELGDGTPVTVPSGTQVTRHILEDQSLSDPSATVRAMGLYTGGRWSVVLRRNLVVPGESTAGGGSLSDTDYAFDVRRINYFGFAATDNSGHDHKGVALVSLMFAQTARAKRWELYK